MFFLHFCFPKRFFYQTKLRGFPLLQHCYRIIYFTYSFMPQPFIQQPLQSEDGTTIEKLRGEKQTCIYRRRWWSCLPLRDTQQFKMWLCETVLSFKVPVNLRNGCEIGSDVKGVAWNFFCKLEVTQLFMMRTLLSFAWRELCLSSYHGLFTWEMDISQMALIFF